jgi:hypothetical protein
MRALLSLSLVAVASCGGVRIPGPPGLTISLHAQVRADVQVKAPPPAPVAIEGAQVVEFFGVPLDGAQDIVFVFDRSGSMSDPAQGQIAQIHMPVPTAVPSKIDVARQELIDALTKLPAGTRVDIIFFDNELEGFAQDLVALDDTTRANAIEFVKEAVPSGSTALTPAMRTAFLMNAKRVVLLSDGLGNVGPDSRVLVRDAREAIRGGVRIDTVGLGRDQDGPLLGTLAAESGGIYQAL